MKANERQNRHQERRRAILAAAQDIARHGGWEQVTVRKVAARVGCTAPVIYEYFNSKDQIVVEVLRDGFRHMLDAMRKAHAAHREPFGAVVAIGTAYWDYVRAHREVYTGIHGRTAFGWPLFRSRRPEMPPGDPFPEAYEMFVFVRDALEQLIAPAAPDLEALSWYVVKVWACLHGVIMLTMDNLVPNGRRQGRRLIEEILGDLLSVWRSGRPTGVLRNSRAVR